MKKKIRRWHFKIILSECIKKKENYRRKKDFFSYFLCLFVGVVCVHWKKKEIVDGGIEIECKNVCRSSKLRLRYHLNVCSRNNRESIKSWFGVFVIGKKKAKKNIDLSEPMRLTMSHMPQPH